MTFKLRLGISIIAIVVLGYLLHWSRATHPVVVAFDAPLSERAAFDPTESDAIQLYLEETPNSLIQPQAFYYDFEPKNGRKNFTDALASDITFYITTQPSSLAVASTDLFSNDEMLTFNTSATSLLFSGRDDFMLRVIPDLKVEQNFIVDWMATNLGEGTLLVLQDASNAAYTDPAYEIFSNRMAELGIQLEHARFDFNQFVLSDYYGLIEQDFAGLYLLAGDFLSSIGHLAQFFHFKHPSTPIFITPWAESEPILERAGPALRQTTLFAHQPAREANPQLDDYLTRFQQRFGYLPSAMAIYIRQTLELLELALQKGYQTPRSARDFLLGIGVFQTSLGEVRIDPNGDRISTLFPRTLKPKDIR